MTSVFIWWAIWGLILIIGAARVGKKDDKSKYFAILRDNRGRISLNHFQIVLWTILILSMFAGVAFARIFGGVDQPLNIIFPDELLILMGISVGTSVAAGSIKAGKDQREAKVINDDPPALKQMYQVEEGSVKGIVDVTRFQNLWMTIILVILYLLSAISYIKSQGTVANMSELPGFDETLMILMGISHAGYIGGKVPDRK